MYELRTLGQGDLRDASDGRVLRSVLAQPKRLALLAYLAVEGAGRFHRRDTLLGIFWPGSSERQARHALSQSIYFLRQGLGADALLTRGEEEVAVSPTHVWCDAAAFDALLADGDAEAALALYQGEMLPGFHLDDSVAFDQWLAAERERRRARAVAAAHTLARTLENGGNGVGAVRWLRRAVEWSPYDEALARELTALLHRLGDRPGAVLELDGLELRLERDLELEPSAETRALAASIRSVSNAPAPVVRTEPAAGAVIARSEPAEPAPDATVPLPRAPRALRFRPHALAAVGLIVVAVLSGVVWRARPQTAAADPALTRLAVLPFDVRGNERLAYLGEGMALLLSAKLDGAGTLRSVDPRAVLNFVSARRALPSAELGRDVARHFGAQQFALGSALEVGGRLSLHVGLYDGEGRLQAEASAEAADEVGIFAMVDDLARALIAGRHGTEAERLTRIAAQTTESLPALKAYLDGERAYRAGRFAEAATAFERAALADSTFALAHYRLSLSSLWADVPDTLPFDADARALRHSARLSDHDRQLLLAYDAWRRGDAQDAERLYRNVVTLYPDDAEAWLQLGETLFHYNPLRGRPLAEARAPFEEVLRLDPSSWAARWHLMLVAASEGRMADFHDHARRLESLEPDRAHALELGVLEAMARPGGAVPASLLDRLRDLHALQLHEIAWRVGVHLHDPAAALRIARLATAPDRPFEQRMPAHVDVGYLELTVGRDRAAHDAFDVMQGIEPRIGELRARAFAYALPFRRASHAELEDVRTRLIAWPPRAQYPDDRVNRAYALGLLEIALGDTAAALRRADDVDRIARAENVFDEHHGWAETLRAWVAYDAGRFEETLHRLARAPTERWFGWASSSPDHSGMFGRWLRAEALRELGRDDEALVWYASFGEHAIHDLTLLAPSHLRRAEIHERRGERAAAATHYARAIELWQDADPELRPVVDRARRNLERLTGE